MSSPNDNSAKNNEEHKLEKRKQISPSGRRSGWLPCSDSELLTWSRPFHPPNSDPSVVFSPPFFGPDQATTSQDKREELEAEAKAKRIAESTGGLDPQEVFDSLPEEMWEAFETQSKDKMHKVAERMDAGAFLHHLERCIDSGLWIPDAKEHEERQQKKAKEERWKKKGEGGGEVKKGK